MSSVHCGWDQTSEKYIVNEHCLNSSEEHPLHAKRDNPSGGHSNFQGIGADPAGIVSVGHLTSISPSPCKTYPSPSLLSFSNGQPRFPHPVNFPSDKWNDGGISSQFLISPQARSGRRTRHFVPNERKDEYYWQKRRKNNEAARKSREKRRTIDSVLEEKVMQLTYENKLLRDELHALKIKYGEIPDDGSKLLKNFENDQLVTNLHPRSPSEGVLQSLQGSTLNGAIVTLVPRQTKSIGVYGSQMREIPELLSTSSLQHQSPPAQLEVIDAQVQPRDSPTVEETSDTAQAIDLSVESPRKKPPAPDLLPLDMTVTDRSKSSVQAKEDDETFLAANALASLYQSSQTTENGTSVRNGQVINGIAHHAEKAEEERRDDLCANGVEAVSPNGLGNSLKNNLPYKLRFKYSKGDAGDGPSP